jgi:hypothetical protein
MLCKIHLFIGLYVFFTCSSQAISIPSTYEITTRVLQKHVAYLSSDALEGRLTGTRGEKLSTEYVANAFLQLGLEPAGDKGTFFQTFDFGTKQQGRNVLAKLRVSPNNTGMIIIGAHVDHLGRGKVGSRDTVIGRIHPGADDNASGVASMLEVAAQLKYQKEHGQLQGNKDILFAAWSGEELGILGSSHFVMHFIKTAKNKALRPAINEVINLDMVGHLRDYLVLQGIGSSSDWLKIIKRIQGNHSVKLITKNDPYLPTDTTAFYLQGVPTINFFTGAHDNYHTSRDKPELLNYEGIKTISDFLVDLVHSFEARVTPITYREVQKSGGNAEQGFTIYLGTIPDYASTDVSGVKLSGVAKNSPAEQGGIKSGDIIIEVDKKRIHDIYEYTSALNALRVGEPTQVVVLRAKMKIALTVVAQHRE